MRFRDWIRNPSGPLCLYAGVSLTFYVRDGFLFVEGQHEDERMVHFTEVSCAVSNVTCVRRPACLDGRRPNWLRLRYPLEWFIQRPVDEK